MPSPSRLIIAYIIAVPLALVLGCFVAVPSTTSVAGIGMVLCFLLIPLVIQWHHTLLIVFWNSAFMFAFFPGQPLLWQGLAILGFGIAVINHITGLKTFLRIPELTKPILVLLAVIVLTGMVRGGIGIHVLGGSSYGGKRYINLFIAIMGYFALTSQTIPASKGERLAACFFLAALTTGLPNLIYVLGHRFYFLYNFISSGAAQTQAAADYFGQDVVERFAGLGPAGIGLLCFVLARWGIRRTFEWDKPWRVGLLVAALIAGVYSGFRSQVGLFVLLLGIQFILEQLWKGSMLPVLVLLGVACLTPVILFANKMPFTVQRSLAFLPVNINPNVRSDAEASTAWRKDMWSVIWSEVPDYLFLGKGYALDPTELYLVETASKWGILGTSDLSMATGDYHSGPLSILMPFGIWGALAFLWVLGAGAKALYSNYRYGDPRFKLVNRTLMAFFLAQCLMFFFVFGDLISQLPVVLGILGFSVCLNGGVRRKIGFKYVPAATVEDMALEPA